MRPFVWLLALPMLAGCISSPGPFNGLPTGEGGEVAVYRHPTTADVQHCVNRTMQGAMLWGVFGGVSAGNAYADCKTSLEQAGYQREAWPRGGPPR